MRLVLVPERLDVIEYVPDLDHVPGGDPEFLLRLPHAISLDGLDLIHRVVLLLTPLELLVQEVQDHEVQGPEVVPPTEVLHKNLTKGGKHTTLLCAFSEAKDTVPRKSAFLRYATGTPLSSKCFFESPKSTMYTC